MADAGKKNSVITPSGGESRECAKSLKLRLIGHCILCLRKVTNAKSNGRDDDLLSVVPKAVVVSSDFLNLFNGVWPWIQSRKRRNEEEGGAEVEELITFYDVMNNGRNKGNFLKVLGPDITFSRLPTMCQPCADKVQQVEDLVKAVRTQVEQIRNVIRDSNRGGQYSWRGEQFERNLKSSKLERYEINSTLKFLNEIAGCSLELEPEMMFQDEQCKAVESKRMRLNSSDTSAVMKNHVFHCPISDDITVLQHIDEDYENSTHYLNISDKTNNDTSDTNNVPMDLEEETSEIMNLSKSDDDDYDDPDYVKSEQESLFSGDEDDISIDSQTLLEEEAQEKTSLKFANGVAKIDDNDPLGDVSCSSFSSVSIVVGEKRPYKVSKIVATGKLEKRKSSEKQEQAKQFKCEVKDCFKSYASKSILSRHKVVSHPDIYGLVPCSCGEAFPSEQQRRHHLSYSTKHSKEEYQQISLSVQNCDMCGKKVRQCELADHLKGHTGDYVVKCPNSPCQIMYTNSFRLALHLKSCRFKSEKNSCIDMNVCETCGFKGSSRLVLRGHITKYHERASEKNFICPFTGCEERFSVRQSVDLHLKFHSSRPKKTQTCDRCSESIEIDSMIKHLKECHKLDEKDIIKCQQCDCVFSSRQYLVEHSYVHRHIGIYCDICKDGVKYEMHKDFRNHCQSAHNIYCTEHMCEFCSKAFWCSSNLRSHLQRKHPPNVNSDLNDISTATISSGDKETSSKANKKKQFSCDLCFEESKTFVTEDSLITHKIRIHGADPFKCAVCDATFTSRGRFTRHKKEHAGIKFQKEFHCEHQGCEKVFSSNKLLTYHKKTGHGAARTHRCQLCEKAYFDASALKRHHDTVHLNIRPFVCDECGESFGEKNVLERHKFIHTGDRPYACPLCGQRFRHREVLKRHEEAHEKKGADFKPNGPMKHIRKRTGQ